MMAECEKSLGLLSDYHDGALDELERAFISTHLAKCKPCEGIYKELDTIVLTATLLRNEDDIAFPDEEAIWQRISVSKSTIH